MPTRNRIRVLLAENHETAKSIVPMLPDVDRSSMSYIVQGRVLPTKQTLNAMTAALNCETKDLYDLNDIDLAGKEISSCVALHQIIEGAYSMCDLCDDKECEWRGNMDSGEPCGEFKFGVLPESVLLAIKNAPLVMMPAEKPSIKLIGDHGHDGMERVYIWYPRAEKEALLAVVKQLGYPSVAEWFRDMARITFLKAAKLNGQTLHEAAKEATHEQS
jgi:hypothetical protein